MDKRGGMDAEKSSEFCLFPQPKNAQLTVFIIIAVLIVGAAGFYFLLRENVFILKIPASIEPVYNSFLECVGDRVFTGANVLGSQAGYIHLPEFKPGSQYMPFSSQLSFLGNNIPYWYYVSGNNIEDEQVPSKADMERELSEFVEEKIRGCSYEDYYEEGFEINQGEPKAAVSIRDSEISVNLNMDLTIKKGEDSFSLRSHRLKVSSKLGGLYNSAIKVYQEEQENLFLEDYAVDVLRIYAPVDGVEFSCSPETWNAASIFGSLQEAFEANTLALRTEGDSYFSVDVPVSNKVRFINSRSWPVSLEVLPSEGDNLIAKPVGNQQGLGALGFCYVPYHFVYSIKYPVLVQVYEGEEVFQFPLAVIIQGNKPRTSLKESAAGRKSAELCSYKNTPIIVNTMDSELNLVDADIYYECFGETCSIGKTSSGFLEAEFPQCSNGFIIARAEGFKDERYLHSTTEQGSADLFLDRIYEREIELKLDGIHYDGKAIITFSSDEYSGSVIYPEQKKVKLSEGDYQVQVQVYEDSSLSVDAGKVEQCMEVSKGLGALFGITQKECFDIDVPSQIISSVLTGGGTENYYVLESELKNSEIIEIDAESSPKPSSLEQLQNNYISFESKGLSINFK